MSHFKRLFCTGSVKINTEYLKILKNIHRSAFTFNTKDYPLFLFDDILEISGKKIEKIFIKAIQHIIFEYLEIFEGNVLNNFNRIECSTQ